MELNPHNYAEIVAALTCTICLLIKATITNKWFTCFLWLTVCVELTGKLIVQYPHAKYCMYNLFGILECSFYLYYFKTAGTSKMQILRMFVTALLVLSTLNFLFFESINSYSVLVSITCTLLVLSSCLLIMYLSITDNTAYYLSKINLLIITGILIFYAGSFFADAFVNTTFSKSNPALFSRFYRIINGSLNVIMYGCFAIAFILEVLQKKTNPKIVLHPYHTI